MKALIGRRGLLGKNTNTLKGGAEMGKRGFSSMGMVLASAVMSLVALPGVSLAAEFSADLIINTSQGRLTGKVYVKGDKHRQELSQMGRKTVVIVRKDKKVVWTLMPAQKMAMEMSIPEGSMNNPGMKRRLEEMAEKKYLGKETVNGYVCEKYRYVYRDKSMGTMTQWLSTKLKFPIKMEQESPSGNMLMEYKNIKKQRLSNSLFEIPAGYKKMSVPMMPGMGRK